MRIQDQLQHRYPLSIDEYDRILDLNMEWMFGIKDKEVHFDDFAKIYEHSFHGQGRLVLERIKDYHREYAWS